MASHISSNLAEGLTAPAASESNCHLGLVWPCVRTIEDVLDYVVNSRQSNTGSIIGFHWLASDVHHLYQQLNARLFDLAEPKVQRFEYDYESQIVYLDIMDESPIHHHVRMRLRDHIIADLATLIAVTDGPLIRQLTRSIGEYDPIPIEFENKLFKQADLAFGQSEPRQHMWRKAHQYIDLSGGKIRAVLILDLQYSGMKKAWVSLLTTDGWAQHHEVCYDDDLDKQPIGQVDLYLSDFVDPASLPLACCRSSTAELTGITKNPAITLTYDGLRAIFRRARHLCKPTECIRESSDEETLSMEAERCIAEADRHTAEADRQTAEPGQRIAEAEQRIANAEQRIASAEQRMVEAERRTTEVRLETEQRVAEARNEGRLDMERRVRLSRRKGVWLMQSGVWLMQIGVWLMKSDVQLTESDV
ncbi:uncharacterized protein B0H64DRAFT_423149 [Chaetomium fimeti]|uniref:Uncharacterized protein n=1 Tax=Chaetomium fimeti TaxID=1854472 RepID=A0AAE0LTZ3_9PEZI|nr:hypothetical protein B0H64DRAFT_423149 [Chaetomium fimeti]